MTIKLLGRKILHRALGAALRLRSHPAALDNPGRTLVIAPHQDDETLGCGGYILLRRLEALPVDVLYITDGRASHPQHPRLSAGQIATLRGWLVNATSPDGGHWNTSLSRTDDGPGACELFYVESARAEDDVI